MYSRATRRCCCSRCPSWCGICCPRTAHAPLWLSSARTTSSRRRLEAAALAANRIRWARGEESREDEDDNDRNSVLSGTTFANSILTGTDRRSSIIRGPSISRLSRHSTQRQSGMSVISSAGSARVPADLRSQVSYNPVRVPAHSGPGLEDTERRSPASLPPHPLHRHYSDSQAPASASVSALPDDGRSEDRITRTAILNQQKARSGRYYTRTMSSTAPISRSTSSSGWSCTSKRTPTPACR